jgi:hypothetical protein
MVVEVLAEHERVGDQGASRVVADEQSRAFGRDVLEAADVSPEIKVRRESDRRQRPLDVDGIAQHERIAPAAVGHGGGDVLAERCEHSHVCLRGPERRTEHFCQSSRHAFMVYPPTPKLHAG